MIYVFGIFMLVCGYYTLTYGISMWKEDNNKLGGFGAVTLGVFGTLIPIITLITKF